MILALTQNGFPVPGATASATITTADDQVENLKITATIRVMCNNPATLSVLVDGTAAPTVQNMAFRAVKVV